MENGQPLSDRGAQTRKKIINKAMDMVSTCSLAHVSVEKLAKSLGMSKSGVYSHFGSTERLHLMLCDQAREVFVADVIAQSQTESAVQGDSFKRLLALMSLMVDRSLDDIVHGIPFFASVSHELDGVGGPVARMAKDFWDLVHREVSSVIHDAAMQGLLNFAGANVDKHAPGLTLRIIGTAVAANMLWQAGTLSKNEARAHAHQAMKEIANNIVADDYFQP